MPALAEAVGAGKEGIGRVGRTPRGRVGVCDWDGTTRQLIERKRLRALVQILGKSQSLVVCYRQLDQ